MGKFLKGHIVTKERREKISEKMKGKKPWNYRRTLPQEMKDKIANTLMGHEGAKYNHTEEAKRKISEGNKGKIISEERKKRLSQVNIGKKLSLETKKKMSLKLKGRLKTEKTKREISKTLQGHFVSEETKEKIALSQKGKVLSKEQKRKIGEGVKNFYILNPEFRDRFNCRGEKHWNWQNGKSFEPYSSEWTEGLKKEIKERDGYQCQNPYCEEKDLVLSVHHIDYNKKNSEFWNLIVLCVGCNAKANYNKEYWQALYTKIMEEKIGFSD